MSIVLFFAQCCLGRSRAERPSVSEVEVKITASAVIISRKKHAKQIKQINKNKVVQSCAKGLRSEHPSDFARALHGPALTG